MSRRVIVLGIMRSGTSLTAELVRQWGAYAGPEYKLWKSEMNDPRGYGYMEYMPLQELNDELLDNNDRVPALPERMEEKASDPVFREKALQLIHTMDTQALKDRFDTWVWKDARLPLTLPFWVKLWDDPIYVITIRHPADVTRSSAKTEDFDQENLPFSAGLAYWQYCMLNILLYTQKSRRKIFIAYDQLINSPQQECRRLHDFLDEDRGTRPVDVEERVKAMASKIEKGHRHYQYEKSLAEMEQATREQRALYNFLRVKTMNPEEIFNRDDFSLYPGWREYLQAMDMILSLSRSQEKTT